MQKTSGSSGGKCGAADLLQRLYFQRVVMAEAVAVVVVEGVSGLRLQLSEPSAAPAPADGTHQLQMLLSRHTRVQSGHFTPSPHPQWALKKEPHL